MQDSAPNLKFNEIDVAKNFALTYSTCHSLISLINQMKYSTGLCTLFWYKASLCTRINKCLNIIFIYKNINIQHIVLHKKFRTILVTLLQILLKNIFLYLQFNIPLIFNFNRVLILIRFLKVFILIIMLLILICWLIFLFNNLQ